MVVMVVAFSGKFSSDIAFLLIDMQPFLTKYVDDAELGRMVDSQIAVIDFCACNDLPLIAVGYGLGSLEKDNPKEYGMMERLRVAVGRVPRHEFMKKYTDCAFSTKAVDEQLKAWGVGEIGLMGVYASECVKACALKAVRKGYTIFTAEDLIADYSIMTVKGKSEEWYSEKGKYFPNHDALLGYVRTRISK